MSWDFGCAGTGATSMSAGARSELSSDSPASLPVMAKPTRRRVPSRWRRDRRH